MGVNVHLWKGGEQKVTMLTDAGVGIARTDVRCRRSEKERGKYDFVRHDRLISGLERRSIRLLFIIDYGNKLYDNGLP